MTTEVPSWAVMPIETFRTHLRTIDELLHVTMRGLDLVTRFPELISSAPAENLFVEKEIALFKQEAEIAQREHESGYPVIHEQAVVTLWATLEALVRGFLAAWIANWPDCRSADKIRNLKLPFGEYEDLPLEEKPYFVLDLLEESIGCRRKGGIDRFESVFAVFNMTTSVDADVKKTLFELSHIRHVIVHRSGLADRRLLAWCPWLGYELGDKVRVSHSKYHEYLDASYLYTFEIIQRVRRKYGLPPAEHDRSCRFATELDAIEPVIRADALHTSLATGEAAD